MKVLLLAAGLGTRLRPLTNKVPKCLVEINGRPLLDIWLEALYKLAPDQILINTHYLADKVLNYLNFSSYKDSVTTIHEDILLGTAGTLYKNKNHYDQDDLMLVHADNYCLADLSNFYVAHLNRPKSCVMTMMTFATDSPSSCGIVELDVNGIVVGFHEKIMSPPGNNANAAVYLIAKDFWEMSLINEQTVDFSTEVIPKLMGKIFTYKNTFYHRDIGNLDSLAKAQFLG